MPSSTRPASPSPGTVRRSAGCTGCAQPRPRSAARARRRSPRRSPGSERADRDRLCLALALRRARHDPTLVDPARDPGAFNAERSTRRLPSPRSNRRGVDDPDALRHWKRREYLRIAARDLLGVADLPTVGRELAALAEVCLGRASLLAEPEVRFAVIAMGKLGGPRAQLRERRRRAVRPRGRATAAEHAARRLLCGDGRADARGHRVPHRRRPPARGPVRPAHPQPRRVPGLVRAVGPDLGVPGPDQGAPGRRRPELGAFIEAGRAVRVAGRPRTRRGARGPRDEGTRRGRDPPARPRRPGAEARPRRHPRHRVRGAAPPARPRPPRRRRSDRRTPSTHSPSSSRPGTSTNATRCPSTPPTGSSAPSSTASSSGTSSRPTRFPTDAAARTRLARVLGYRDRGRLSAAEQLDAEHRAHQGRVRSTHEKLFFGPLLEALSGRPGPLTPTRPRNACARSASSTCARRAPPWTSSPAGSAAPRA